MQAFTLQGDLSTSEKQSSSHSITSKISSPRGDGGIDDEEEDSYSAINNRISNLLIDDGVIPPTRPLNGYP
jgi:hypothetical protein